MKLKDVKFLSHVNMQNQGIRMDTAIIVAPGHELHGKSIIYETVTPRTKGGKLGQPKRIFYLHAKGAPRFERIEDLAKHYNLGEIEGFEPKPEAKLKSNK